jgi:hypothetical protein
MQPNHRIASDEKRVEFIDGVTTSYTGARSIELGIPHALVDRFKEKSILLRPYLPTWLAELAHRTMAQVEILVANWALEAAFVRLKMLREILDAEQVWSEGEVSVDEAATMTKRCPETIRRSVNDGRVPSRRNGERGHHRIRRGDLHLVEKKQNGKYDVHADAQDIVRKRAGT